MAVNFITEDDGPGFERRVKYDWKGITKTLRENPMKWAVIEGTGVVPTETAAAAVARRIRNGDLSNTARRGEFQAASRGKTVYMRYVGDEPN